MQPRHRVSRAAIDLIKAFEGYRRKAARLADGRWTIGYGHTLTARQGAEVSEQDAEALLTYDLIAVAHAVNEHVYTPLTQNQFDALVAFAFNIGVGPFRASSVLRRINEGQMLQAANAMELWRRAEFEGERIVIDALVRRRAAEKTLFLTPVDGWVPAPSAILTPGLDLEGDVSRETPAVLTVSLDGAEALAERDPADQAPEAAPTATQRAAEAVTARLQTIFPDEGEPAVAPPPPAPKPVRPAPAAPANDVAQVEPAARTERLPLPPPAWPANLGASDRPFRLSPSSDQDLEPVVEDHHKVAPFDPQMLDQAMSSADDGAPVQEEAADRVLEVPAAKPAPLGWAPLGGLAALGLVFFVGGLFWSAGAKEGGGPFNPWIVGTLACLAGVGFMTLAAYLIMARLGRLEGAADEDGHTE